jgi:SNF2 family DNA or RNA helicase
VRPTLSDSWSPIRRISAEEQRSSDYNRIFDVAQKVFPLHRRIRPLMLRRRKDEVEDQLPKRTVNNYFVDMSGEQQLGYDEYNSRAAKLLMIAKRRPLTHDELERLQRLLACMRMVCDTPFIAYSDEFHQ